MHLSGKNVHYFSKIVSQACWEKCESKTSYFEGERDWKDLDGGSGVSEKTIGTIITMIKLDKLSPFEEEDKVSGGDDTDN